MEEFPQLDERLRYTTHMVDEVMIGVKAGDGGNGKVSFRREKFVPRGGPDGGDGGNGGSIGVESDANLATLQHFASRQRFVAENGGDGGGARKTGKNGSDIVLRVPVGTVVELQIGSAALQLLADLDKPGMRVWVVRGGRGGQGNSFFRSSTNQAPRTAEKGKLGEARWLRLTLKVLAQVGLVGLPNAGKSTLLSVLTAAKPEIAAYPFTTLSPNLGVLKMGRASLVLADIPGLIEGASKGKGLGVAFLKHVERCELLVYVLFPEETLLFQAEEGVALVGGLWEQREEVRREMRAYNPRLSELPSITVVNKIDLLSEKQVESILRFFRRKKISILPISAATLKNIEELKRKMVRGYRSVLRKEKG